MTESKYIGRRVRLKRDGETHIGLLTVGNAIFATNYGAERAFKLIEEGGGELEFAASDWKIEALN